MSKEFSDIIYSDLLSFIMNYHYLVNELYFGNTVQTYFIAFGLFLLLWVIFKLFKRILIKKLIKLFNHKKTVFIDDILNIVDQLPPQFYLLLSIYFPLQTLSLPASFHKVISIIFFILIVIYLTQLINNLFLYAIKNLFLKNNNKKIRETNFQALKIVIGLIIWSIAFLLVLSNLGLNITSLVASLGIGGIAIALAVQNILSDILSSFSIYFDKPFVVGDFISLGNNHSGTVTSIGLKTTRIQTLQGEELVISNRELTSIRVQNFKKLKKRRVVFNLSIDFDTSIKKLEKINQIITKIIGKIPDVQLSRVHLKEIADYSFLFEVVYTVESNDYMTYMEVQEQINLAILKAFEKEKIKLAFPTQTVELKK